MKNKYVKEYNTYFTEKCKRKQELIKMLSQCDLQQEDILHFIELEKCDAVSMAKATKQLKIVRQKRREIKNELAVVAVICDRLKTTLEDKDFVGGVYKTDIIKEIK